MLAFALRWTRRCVIGLLLFALLLVTLYLTRGSTLHPLLVRLAPAVSRAFTPFEVHVASIEGDWYSTLTIRGLEVTTDDPRQVLRTASADEVTVEGALVDLARTLDLAALTRAQVRAPRVEIDTRGQASPEQDESSRTLAPGAYPNLVMTDGSLTWIGEHDIIQLSHLVARSPAGKDLSITLTGEAVANAWSATLSGAVTIDRDGTVSFAVDIPDGHVQELDLHLEGVRGSASSAGLTIDSGVVRVGPNEVVMTSLRVTPEPTGPPSIGGVVAFDVPRLDEIPGIVDAALGRERGSWSLESLGWFGSATGTISLEPRPGFVATGTFVVAGTDVVVAGVRIGTVSATLVADDERIIIEELRASDPGRAFIDATGAYVLATQALEDVSASIRMENPEVYSGALNFVHGLDLQLHLAGPLDALSGDIRLRADSFDPGERSIGRLDIDATLDAGTLDLSRVVAETDFGRVSAAGMVTLPVGGAPLDGRLRELTIERGGARLALVDPVAIAVDGERIVIEDLRLAGSGGEVEIDLDTRTAVGVRVSGVARGLQLAPFLTDVLNEGAELGTLDGSITFQSDPVLAAVDLTMTGARMAVSEDPIGARAVATWRDGRIEISELRAHLAYGSIDLSGTAPLDLSSDPLQDGEVRLTGSARFDTEAFRSGLITALLTEESNRIAARFDGSAALAFDLAGTWRDLRGTGQLDLDGVDFRGPDGEPSVFTPGPFSGSVGVAIGDNIRLVPSELRAGEVMTVACEAQLGRSLDLVALVDDPGPWLDAALDVSVQFTCDDLGWIAGIDRELRETSGRLTADAHVTGTLRAPEPTATAHLEDGTLRYRGAPRVDEIEITAHLTPERLEFDRTTFLLGASPVHVEGRLFLAEESLRFEIGLDGEDVLLFRSPDARIRANVDLALTGSPADMLLAGEVALVGGRIRSPVEFQRLLEGGSGAPGSVRRGLALPSLGPESIRLDIRVTTVDPMQLKGRLTRGAIRSDLRLIGNASHPIPSGRIFVDPLVVALPAGNVRFPTGLIQFNPNNPEIPELEFVGSTRLAGYDVSINVSGPFDEPEIDMSASPPLNHNDLFLLVLTGRPPTTGVGAAAAGEQIAFYVAKDLVRGWFDSGGFEDNDRESFIDRVEVVTGRDVSRGGVMTVEGTLKLKDGFIRERDSLYAVVVRDAFEDYNFGIRLVLKLR